MDLGKKLAEGYAADVDVTEIDAVDEPDTGPIAIVQVDAPAEPTTV